MKKPILRIGLTNQVLSIIIICILFTSVIISSASIQAVPPVIQGPSYSKPVISVQGSSLTPHVVLAPAVPGIVRPPIVENRPGLLRNSQVLVNSGVDTLSANLGIEVNGTFVTKWGTGGTGNGQFKNPSGVAVSPTNGRVYIVDPNNYRVQVFDPNGTFITKWGRYGKDNGQFSSPYGIAIAPDGRVYVMDTYNNRIQAFDPDGMFITKWGTGGSKNGQFLYPRGGAVGPNERIYIADWNNNRIQVFSI